MINEAIGAGGTAFGAYYEIARLGLLALMRDAPPRQVLEIGCGAGATLGALKSRFPGCEVTGLDERIEAVHAAQQSGLVDQVVHGDVLDAQRIDFAAHRFDVIVLSHVLEHFAQPELVLARARQWLAPEGYLLVALPNLRHLSVLVELLLRADFQYRAAGILDHTHLRFYTRKSALRFLREAGWQVEACTPEIDGPKSRLFHRLTLGLASDLAAYAYNFRVRRA